MINLGNFIDWLHAQDRRTVRAHIAAFISEKKLQPSFHEFKSVSNQMYSRLRKSPNDFPMIDYKPVGHRARDPERIKYGESRDLQAVTEVIKLNGFAYAATTTALEVAQSTHATATVSQQKSYSEAVKALGQELQVRDIQAANAEQLAKRDRELANDRAEQLAETRRDKVFLQQQLSKGTGSSIV